MFNEDELTSWINVQPNFDNVFWAYLALFQIVRFHTIFYFMQKLGKVDLFIITYSDLTRQHLKVGWK